MCYFRSSHRSGGHDSLSSAYATKKVGRHVEISVIASDAEGRRPGDLSKDDFEITDNGARRPIEDFHVLAVQGIAY